MRNGSEVRDPLVDYVDTNPPASPLQGDLSQQGPEDRDPQLPGCPPASISSSPTPTRLSCPLSLVLCPLTPELHSPSLLQSGSP